MYDGLTKIADNKSRQFISVLLSTRSQMFFNQSFWKDDKIVQDINSCLQTKTFHGPTPLVLIPFL